MKYNQNIPQGTRDIIFAEAELYSDITERTAKVFSERGFRQVRTPAVEFYDVFDCNKSLRQESMYKLTDKSGRLIALRADNTTPMARVAATKLRGYKLPVKLFYSQNIYRINSGWSGHRGEILQNGVEIIGATGIKSDLVCITASIAALEALELNFKIELGNVGYYNAMIAELGLESDEVQRIREYVEQKNLGKIERYGKISRIPMLYGGCEVFAEALDLAGDNREAADALLYIKRLYDLLCGAGYEDKIMVDMGIVHDIDYYTGMVFRGYTGGAGEPVLTGGRYDRLLSAFGEDIPATGFALNVGLIADTVIKNKGYVRDSVPGCLVFFCEDDFPAAEKFAAENGHCEYSCHETFSEALDFARERGICRAVEIRGGKISADIITSAENEGAKQ